MSTTSLSACSAQSFRPGLLTRAAAALAAASLPLLFILLWSSGYVAGKLALAHTGPLTLLTLRFGLAAVVLISLALATGAPWPHRASAWGHLAVVGLLMQVLHFSCIYFALQWGLSAGVAGLMIGLMPLATALGAHLWLAESLGTRQALGLLGGLAGVALVVAEKPLAGAWPAYGAAALGLLGLVAGTLYQKRFCAHMDLRTGSAIQFAASSLALLPFALAFETMKITWSGEFIFALAWLCVVLSLGAITLLYILIRRGAAARVASLFYLVPPCTAVVAWFLFGERLSALAWAGMALVALGVALVNVRR